MMELIKLKPENPSSEKDKHRDCLQALQRESDRLSLYSVPTCPPGQGRAPWLIAPSRLPARTEKCFCNRKAGDLCERRNSETRRSHITNTQYKHQRVLSGRADPAGTDSRSNLGTWEDEGVRINQAFLFFPRSRDWPSVFQKSCLVDAVDPGATPLSGQYNYTTDSSWALLWRATLSTGIHLTQKCQSSYTLSLDAFM